MGADAMIPEGMGKAIGCMVVLVIVFAIVALVSVGAILFVEAVTWPRD